jgi:putative DNA primase/helicase
VNGIERDFADALAAAGLEAFGQLRIRADGRIHRYRLADDRPGKKNGWFVLHDGPAPFGVAGDWKSGYRFEWIALEANGKRVEQGAFEESLKRHADEQLATWAGAQRRAQDIWARLPVAQADHPYLAKKQVAPGPCRLTCNGRLVVPVYDADRDDLVSLQFVSDDGGKRFLAGGRTGGGHCWLGLLHGAATIIICEGYATGATLHAATGDPVVVAFNCGNLLAVGKALRARHANARIVFAADNDEATAGNPGVSKAMEAAFEVSALFVAPPRPGDFNDLAADYGLEAVRLSIAALGDTQARAELEALVGPVLEPDEVALVRLSRLTALQYDRVRQAEARKLGIKMSTLDEEVAKRRNRPKQSAEAPAPPKKTLKDLEAAAYDIITSHTVLDRFAEDIGKRVAGEEKNLQRLYLIATSRLFEKTMHAAIKGVSSSGKSEIRTEVLAFIPKEDVISFTTLSEKALLYMQDDFAHKARHKDRVSRTFRTICCAS